MKSPSRRVLNAAAVVAWGGAVIFAASLGYFLFSYAVTFRETQQSTAAGSSVLWNLGLFTIFALHHSVFARTRVRMLVAQTVPPPLERSLYVWVASLFFIGVCALWRPVGGEIWRLPSVVGYPIMGLGVWLTIRSAAAIDVWDLAGVRQAQPPGSDSEFKTDGPYGLVRHPIYLGWYLIVFGVPVMTGTRLTFAIISCAYLLIAIPFEERTLRRQSDGKYDRYMQTVRWRLFPGIY